MANLIGLDVGTTGCKAAVFTEDGRVLGMAYREYGIETDREGKAEQDPLLVWRLCRQVLAGACERAAADPRSGAGGSGHGSGSGALAGGGAPALAAASAGAGAPSSGGGLEAAALSLSVQGDAVIPIDRDGEPCCPAVLGMDYRSSPQAAACEARYGGEALFRRTGMRPHAMNSLCKILWLREARPEAWSRAVRVATYADFIAERLLGHRGDWFIDRTMASRTMAWNAAAGDWDDALLSELGLSRSIFSAVRPSGTGLGFLDGQLARECGLRGPVAVVAGAHDQVCGSVGAAVVGDGDAVDSSGTAEVLSTTFLDSMDPFPLYAGYYPCYDSALPGRRFTFALNHVGGLLLRWYRDTWGGAELAEGLRTGKDAYSVIDGGMPEGISPVMFLPHLNGAGTPTCDPASMGAVVGLTLSTTRGDVAKAMLECLSFELALNVQALAVSGVRIERISAVGGGARSPIWLQIKADVLGVGLRTLECKEAGCLGAAVIAGAGAGVYTSVAEGVRRAVRFEAVYEPDPERAEAYARRFAVYRELHAALRPIHQRLRA